MKVSYARRPSIPCGDDSTLPFHQQYLRVRRGLLAKAEPDDLVATIVLIEHSTEIKLETEQQILALNERYCVVGP